MKMVVQILMRGLSAVGLIATLKIALSDSNRLESSVIDVRAALLVFVAPILVYLLFQSEPIQLGLIIKRLFETMAMSNEQILHNLEENTSDARGEFGYSHVVSMGESHKDSMVRYAGEAFSARFSPEELTEILSQQAHAEDAQWLAVYNALGFFAKMAPYFGMMATVVGMVKLLEKMSDFADISANMALAMQGTLYGLVSFLLFYSPLQKLFQEQKTKVAKRNEMIIDWFTSVAQGSDPSYIKRGLLARSAYQKSSLKKGSNQ